MNSEREKMLRGDLYDPRDPELAQARLRARKLLQAFNASAPDATEERQRLLRELLGTLGTGVWIEPPFYCDYGSQIHLGYGSYMNFGCVVLDVAEVRIGARVLFGPNVQIYAATHPMDSAVRASGLELGRPIDVCDDAWIGGGAILLPGARVGARSVVGAGSVVGSEIPDDVLALGNPCRVVRSLG
jgi:maltose O-acetyltransferase